MLENELIGTVYECTGTRGGGGVFGNLYEVVKRDIAFNELGIPGLVLGEWRYGLEPQMGTPRGGNYGLHDFMCSHKFLLITDAEHKHWGVFIPQGTLVDCVERGLKWLRFYGEKPSIDDDDPNTYHYQTVVIDGLEIDALQKVRH